MQVRFRLGRGIPGLLRNSLIVAGQHRQVVILGRRPSQHRRYKPLRRLSRLRYGCPLQQLAQSLVSKKFSRGIRRFNNAVRIQQNSITSILPSAVRRIEALILNFRISRFPSTIRRIWIRPSRPGF